MNLRLYAGATIAVALCILLGTHAKAYAQTHSTSANTTPKDSTMTHHASGTFEVKLTPQPPDSATPNAVVGRMSIDKQFQGDLEGTSVGQMLAVRTAVNGSAGYVAMEQVTGKLQGRSGTFVLQHSGTMTRGVGELSVTVVPDSGTEELAGLAGTMKIIITEGKHLYEFDYTLAKTP